MGWFLYWLKKLDVERRKDTAHFFSVPIRDFLVSNIFEIPISALSCVLLAVISPYIDPSLLDLKGVISIILVGYSSSSIFNSLLSYRKPLA